MREQSSSSQGVIVMGHRLFGQLPFASKESWSADRWRRYLLSRAQSQSERDDIIAMFGS
jgi:hypothetical protein